MQSLLPIDPLTPNKSGLRRALVNACFESDLVHDLKVTFCCFAFPELG